MDQQQTGASSKQPKWTMELSEQDKARLESWTKEQVYESYLTEYIARKKLEQEVIRLNRKLAEIRYMVRQSL